MFHKFFDEIAAIFPINFTVDCNQKVQLQVNSIPLAKSSYVTLLFLRFRRFNCVSRMNDPSTSVFDVEGVSAVLLRFDIEGERSVPVIKEFAKGHFVRANAVSGQFTFRADHQFDGLQHVLR